MHLTLEQINRASKDQAAQLLQGLYEHSPWIAAEALAQRPFRSLAHLKQAMAEVVANASAQTQLALIRAHPELAGKAMVSRSLTAESANEQGAAGLADCTPEEFAKIQQLNAAYNAKFGFPFILAVRGPRGTSLHRSEIIAAFERRLANHPDFEMRECLRNIHRVVELRLNDKFGIEPELGNFVWDKLEALAEFSDADYKERGELTVTYLTNAHRAAAARITQDMQECGFDRVWTDAVGNVVGRYEAGAAAGAGSGSRTEAGTGIDTGTGTGTGNGNGNGSGNGGGVGTGAGPGAPALMTGSHFDTVRNAGKYDGRLGIYVPLACVRELSRRKERLPFALEVVGFAEEEGQRYKASFLAASALVGAFDAAWFGQQDADGISLRDAMRAAGLPATMEAIAAVRRNPADCLGFVEVHIEQGPVLNERNLPLGIVTSINGSVRLLFDLIGQASHAGTTPMDRRRDAAMAAAELALFTEKRAAQDADSVATIGIWNVPNGSPNVVPGRCRFTMDVRAPRDAQRDAVIADVRAECAAICERRGVQATIEETMRAAAAPCAPDWQRRWEDAVCALGVPVLRLPSGAGHDAMKLHTLMPQAMLFVRGQNSGISHNPLESTTSDDIQLATEAFAMLLHGLAKER